MYVCMYVRVRVRVHIRIYNEVNAMIIFTNIRYRLRNIL